MIFLLTFHELCAIDLIKFIYFFRGPLKSILEMSKFPINLFLFSNQYVIISQLKTIKVVKKFTIYY